MQKVEEGGLKCCIEAGNAMRGNYYGNSWAGYLLLVILLPSGCRALRQAGLKIRMHHTFPSSAFVHSSASISAIAGSLGDVLFALDREGNYLVFNQAYRKFMLDGYGSDEGLQVAWSLLPLPVSDKTKIQFGIDKALGGARYQVQEELGIPEHRRAWFELDFSPIHNEYQYVTGVTVLMRDISEPMKVQKELLAAKESAEADARAKSTFLSTMSHEIRTPMNAILGLTELLLHKKLDDNTLENLRAIRFSAGNLLIIINDILDYSRIEAGRFTFDLETFNFFQVLDDLNRSITVSAQARNLVYEVNMSGSIPKYLRGDSVRLTQILLNLLGNSVKFTQTGKVKLTLEIRSETETDLVMEFKVSDTGIGIPKDELASIFQSFTQLNSPRKYKSQGTGLGLSITRHLVEMQQGEISVESEVGRGSQFTFSLPFLKVGQHEVHATPAGELPGREFFAGMKVLLVEDNKINQMLARQILQDWDVSVDLANDGFEAIAKLQRHKFDLILLDLQMPEIDGFEVARYVRKVLKSPSNKIPIVALTADAFHETREMTTQAGMNDFIAKPYQQRDLFRVLRRFSGVPELVKEPTEKQETELENEGRKINFDFIREKFGKDQDTLRYILDVFKNEIGEEIRTIRPLFANEETLKATKVIHKLVSTFTAMGMPDTALTLSVMERMLKQGDAVIPVLEKLTDVEKSYRMAVEQIEPMLKSMG